MEAAARNCKNCAKEFIVTLDDATFYDKIGVPPPTFCPTCRQVRRLAFRNERALYRRKCDLCGKLVVGRVSPDKPYPMYCQACWWSDKWDPTQYGKPYDFSRPFFEQFAELMRAVPHISLLNFNTVESEWVNQETDDKNCYLNVGGHFNEDSAYNTYELNGKNCFDNYWVLRCELCYECIDCERCYKTLFSQECRDCRDTTLSYDCRNCANILGCAGLRNKQYCLFNQQVSKENYQEFLTSHPLSSRETLAELMARAQEIRLSTPRRDRFIVNSVNAEGNYIVDSKNSKNCWDAENIENCKHLYLTVGMKDSYDGSSIGWGELDYEGAHCGGVYSSRFFAYIFGGGTNVKAANASFLEYCYTTPGSSHCFGCVNLAKKEYCVLNRQYTPEEYGTLVSKIKAQMNDPKFHYADPAGRSYGYGEFFPPALSPFGYNESVAQEYYPLTRDQALARGFAWSDYETDTKYEFSDYVIPDDIRDVKDDILTKVLRCEESGKAYRIIPMELEFYRRIGLPIPRRAPLVRHQDRMTKRLPRELRARHCMCEGGSAKGRNGAYTNTTAHVHGAAACPNQIETPYTEDRPEIVYCASCYQAEIQ